MVYRHDRKNLMHTDTEHLQKSRSTGPRTDSGKANSSKNSLSHGLTATSIDRFPAEVQAEFQQYRASLYSEFRPATENEHTYFERYAFSQFLTLQAQTIEGALM